MSRELGDVLDIRPQCERLNAQVSNVAVGKLVDWHNQLAEYGPLVKPMPWWKRKYYRWTNKLKTIIEVIKE